MTVSQLLEMRFDVSAKDSSGYTSLHVATVNEHAVVVKLLLEKRANASARSNKGFTVMIFAVHQDDNVVIRQLLKNSDLNEDVAAGFTTLQSVVMFGRETVVCLLLENEVSVDAKDQFG